MDRNIAIINISEYEELTKYKTIVNNILRTCEIIKSNSDNRFTFFSVDEKLIRELLPKQYEEAEKNAEAKLIEKEGDAL